MHYVKVKLLNQLIINKWLEESLLVDEFESEIEVFENSDSYFKNQK